MSDTDGTAPDVLPYRIPRATPGRRHEDIELRHLVRNRWAKRLGTVLLALFTFWAGSTKDEWSRIPSTSWTKQVDAAMQTVEASRGELIQLSVRVNALQGALEQNGVADQRARTEILGEIRDLRSEMQRWFIAAGVTPPPQPARAAPRPR